MGWKEIMKSVPVYLKYETFDSQLYSRLIDGAGFYWLPSLNEFKL